MSERATCPRFVEIGRLASPEDVPELRLHLEQCLYCQSQWSATKSLIESMRQVPVKAPEVARRQQTRNALVLAAAESQRRRFSPWWVKAAVYAVVVLCAAGVFAAVGTIALPWLQKQRVRTPAAALRDRDGPRATTSLEPTAKIRDRRPGRGCFARIEQAQRDGVGRILGFPDPHHGGVSSTSDHSAQSAGGAGLGLAPNVVTEFQPPAQPGRVGFLGGLAGVSFWRLSWRNRGHEARLACGADLSPGGGCPILGSRGPGAPGLGGPIPCGDGRFPAALPRFSSRRRGFRHARLVLGRSARLGRSRAALPRSRERPSAGCA